MIEFAGAFNLILIGLSFAAEWTDTTWPSYPFMARLSITYTVGGSNICGGSILATNEWNGKGVILTAAHCVSGASNVDVTIGCTKTDCSDAGATSYNADHYAIHPLYDPSLAWNSNAWRDHDIAIIYLSQPITNSGARKVGLHQDIDILANDAPIRVFGYDDALEYADTNYMIASECATSWPGDLSGRVMGAHDFCVRDDTANNGLQSVCMGDGGSPSFYESRQIGLHSWPGSASSCDATLPTVMTSVPYYYEWIANQCPQCVVFAYPNCAPQCLVDAGGCPDGDACHQQKGLIYEVGGRCFKALSKCWGCLANPAAYSTHLEPVECAEHYDYPSCAPMCLQDAGGCPDGVPCHQVKDRIYEVGGSCYTALTTCYGCLANPSAYPQHLAPTKCRAYVYPLCKPNCLTDNGGCPDGIPCHQVKDRIYEVGGQCYTALTNCYGCLNNPAAYSTHLEPVSCTDYHSAQSFVGNFISDITTQNAANYQFSTIAGVVIVLLVLVNMCCFVVHCFRYSNRNRYKLVSVQSSDDDV